MSRRYRFVAACLAAFALVFAQFAVSAHACSLGDRASQLEVSANHDCCPGDADEDSGTQGNICLEHCAYGNASVDNVVSVPVALDAAAPGLRVESSEPAASVDARPERHRAAEPVRPPATILFGVLRI